MWSFYWHRIVEVPGLIFSTTALWLKIPAVIGFFIGLENEAVARHFARTWKGFSPWYSLVPIAALVTWALLRANYEAFREAAKAHEKAIADLTDKLDAARAVGPERVTLLAAEMQQLRTDHSGQLVALSKQINELQERFPASKAPPPEGGPLPLTASHVETRLRERGYGDVEAKLFAEEGLASLRAAGLTDEAAADGFFRDQQVSMVLADLYRNQLQRDPQTRPGVPVVDPSGLFTWGLPLYRAAPANRPAARDRLATMLRGFRRSGAK